MTVRVGVLGAGTVGGALINRLVADRDAIRLKSGVDLEVRKVAVRDLGKERPFNLPEERMTNDSLAVVLDPAGDHSLEAMAARANFSVRHLSRLFEEQMGVGGAQYVERVRVEAARTWLEGSDDGLGAVAKRSGFRSEETMRRAFVRELGVSPGAYRSRFRTSGVSATIPEVGGGWPAVVHRVPVSAPH